MKAFTLIEIVVAIAIAAILSVVSVAAYKDYVLRSKVSSVMPFIDNIRLNVTTYIATQGEVPTLKQLGFNTTAGDDNTTDTSNLQYNTVTTYIPLLTKADTSMYSCPTFGIGAYLSGFQSQQLMNIFGGPGLDGGWINVHFVNNNGVIQTVCDYLISLDGANSGVSGDLIPGCINETDDPNYQDSINAIANAC